MADFPRLKTGAIAQHPATCGRRYSTEVLRFVDGGEQRFRLSPSGLRRWTLDLSLLDESELNALREFFDVHETFTFRDPATGIDYPECRFESDELATELSEDLRGKTTIGIRETRP
jgi:hypothetical protein